MKQSSKMNAYEKKRSEEDDEGCCYLHPQEVFVGVCPFCLYERLFLLAAKQRGGSSTGNSNTSTGGSRRKGRRMSLWERTKKPPMIILPKIFALLNLHRKSENYEDEDAAAISPSQDGNDSFISIRFENNGVAAWDKGKVSKVSLQHCNNMSWNHHSFVSNKDNAKLVDNNKTVLVEHGKPGAAWLTWRKPIGQLVFQLLRWKKKKKIKRSNKGNMCHVGSKLEGSVKVKE